MSGARIALLALCIASASAEDFPLAVGLVTAAGPGADIERSHTSTRVPAYQGDLLFPGDVLRPHGAALQISFCPESRSYRFNDGTVTVQAKRLVSDGKAGSNAALRTACEVPAVTFRTYRQVRTGADRLAGEAAPATTAEMGAAAPNDVIAALSRAISEDSSDLTALTTRAIEWERADRLTAAALDFARVGQLAPKTDWPKDEMRAVLAQQARTKGGLGKTLGVVIGISGYQEPTYNLQYADRDARWFYEYLTGPRGGARPENVELLLNEAATNGAISLALNNAFAHAGPKDTVVIYVAAHGIPERDGPHVGAYILAYDSNRQDPSTMYPMSSLQDVTADKLRPARIQMVADTCNAAYIGETQTLRQNLFLPDPTIHTQVLGLLASRTSESSYECSNLEGGHGAFTYFLLRGLNTDEALDGQLQGVTISSLSDYLTRQVTQFTKPERPHQTPVLHNPNGSEDEILARKDLAGLSFAALPPAENACNTARGVPPDSANDKNDSRPGLLDQRARDLLASWNAGQQVLLRYLEGDQIPMSREDFAQCESAFENASRLEQRVNPLTEARLLFCRGRKRVYDNQLTEAAADLREAIRRDPLGAYSYNALGIALLEGAAPDYLAAIGAFQDAVRLAPRWAYARHNLALALEQDGQYAQAIATYQAALRLGRKYAYIPFNLGLLYERLNRPEDARAAWVEALGRSANMSRAWTAIGLSYALEGRTSEAEAAYRAGLGNAASATDRLTVRHDLALLLVNRKRSREAFPLWALNLKENPDDLPSLVGYSDALYKSGDLATARQLLAHVLSLRAEYAGARLQYARMLIDSQMNSDAEQQLETLVAKAPNNTEGTELLGDLYAQHGPASGALTRAAILYRTAADGASSRRDRDRIRNKLRRLASERPLKANLQQ